MHVFDELSKTPDFARSAREQIAREVAEYAHSVHPGRFGATAEGVLASLKRALKNRDAKRAEHEAEWQAFLARQRSAPGTLSFSANQTPFPNALLAAMNMPPDKKGG
ncbi:hypothetical protein [Dankookia sp. P2]|uniref:hypothetical protein n=1 Tax=Dankookia sp. P2 TaxID=3423955 RepID=UPI003D66F644